MLNPEQIKSILQDRNLKKVSRNAGIKYTVLYQFISGRTENPSYYLIEKLSKYLEANQ